MAEFLINIPRPDGASEVQLQSGKLLFIVGANGVGKSALINLFFRSNAKKATIVLGQRPIWIDNNSAVMSASDLLSTVYRINNEVVTSGRTRASVYQANRNVALVKLVQRQNAIDRELAEAVRSDNADAVKKLRVKPSPISIINKIFKCAAMPIVFSIDEGGAFYASRNGSEPYSITELSDGERNAFLLCADVLTAERDSLILLDEPERHLHAAISGPLINALIEERSDCAFVVGTHDLSLPAANPQASVILLRSVVEKNKAFLWTFDGINESSIIPDDIKMAILGARKKVVFVEGQDASRDKDLYQLLLPGASIVCKESCVKVERAVEGVRGNPDMNWVEAYGIIDADDRMPDQIAKLEGNGIYAIPAYSVEYLYYSKDTVRAVADYYAGVTGKDADEIFNMSQANIVGNMQGQRDRLCARVCEKRIGERITRARPTWKDILAKLAVNVVEDTSVELAAEQKKFDAMVAGGDIDGLLVRYPFRETPVINGIVKAFGISPESYEQIVRKMVLDELPIKGTLLGKMGNIVAAVKAPVKAPLAAAPAIPIPAAADPQA